MIKTVWMLHSPWSKSSSCVKLRIFGVYDKWMVLLLSVFDWLCPSSGVERVKDMQSVRHSHDLMPCLQMSYIL